jgi:hypothetical protein
LERLAGDEIDGFLRHDAAILDLDVAYLGGDLLENNGIEGSLHAPEGGPPTVTTSAISIAIRDDRAVGMTIAALHLIVTLVPNGALR